MSRTVWDFMGDDDYAKNKTSVTYEPYSKIFIKVGGSDEG